MGITTIGRESMAFLIANSGTGPTYMAIGTGSSTELISQSGLLTETDRNAFTSTTTSTSSQVTWTGDWSSTEISGTNLNEFGAFNDSNVDSGNIFHRTVVGSISFVGDRELQIQSTIKMT